MRNYLYAAFSAAALFAGLPASAQIVVQPQIVVQQPAVVAPQPYCTPYTDRLTVAGQTRVTRGTACLQQNGAWELLPAASEMRYFSHGDHMFITPSVPFVVELPREHHHGHDRDHWDHDRH